MVAHVENMVLSHVEIHAMIMDMYTINVHVIITTLKQPLIVGQIIMNMNVHVRSMVLIDVERIAMGDLIFMYAVVLRENRHVVIVEALSTIVDATLVSQHVKSVIMMVPIIVFVFGRTDVV